jgi:hypothetical protein
MIWNLDMPDRLTEIRARVGDSAPITIHGPEPLVRAFEQKDADIAWLLDKVDELAKENKRLIDMGFERFDQSQ